MKPAILYAAKSTEDKRGSNPAQLEDCRTVAEQGGWEVAGEYADQAASAWSGDRGPELAKAMAHAERIAPCGLIVQHSDRLARGDAKQARHLVEVVLWAMKHDVTIVSDQDPQTFTAGLAMAAMMGDRNTEDSRRKSLAVKAGMKRRREAGKHHGGPPAYGTEYRDGEQVPVKAQAPIVKRMFAEYVGGRSQLAITRGLVADGVPTKRGGKWHQGTVRAILANPVYVKLGMIDAETWAKAEAMREARAKSKGGGRGRQPKGRHLFRGGMLRCGQCGEAMVPRTSANRREGPYEVYRCYGRHRDRDSCSMSPVPRALVDSAVYDYFETVGLDVEATRAQLEVARDAKLAEVRALLTEAERAERKAAENFERLRNDYRDGVMPRDEWVNEWKPELEEDLRAATAELERLREHEQDVATWGELRDVEEDTLAKLADLRRAIAGEVQDAGGIDAVRGALARLFEDFVITDVGEVDPGHDDSVGDFIRLKAAKIMYEGNGVLEPRDLSEALPVRRDERLFVIGLFPRAEAVEGFGEKARPILRRQPLQQAENNYADAFTT